MKAVRFSPIANKIEVMVVAAAIGARVYRITLHRKGEADALPFRPWPGKNVVAAFIDNFSGRHSTPSSDKNLERSWYMEEKEASGEGCSRGYVHYGTFGFESKLIDNKTKATRFKRKISDVEEIPLFYEVWYPPEADHAYILFQSFQGRSCKSIVAKTFQSEFEVENVGLSVRLKKLLPGEGSAFSGSSVRKLCLIRKNTFSDLAEQYFGRSPSTVDIELSIKARPRKSLGKLGFLLSSIAGDKARSAIVVDDIEYTEVVAEVRLGSKVRRVGIIGDIGDAGVIDLTNDVDRGPNGHPTFESMTREAAAILADYQTILSSQQC